MRRLGFLIPVGIFIVALVIFACVSPTTKAKVDTATKEYRDAKTTHEQAQDEVEAATTPEEKDEAEEALAEAKIVLEEAKEKRDAAKLVAKEEKHKQTSDWISFVQMLLLGALGAGGYRKG